MWDDEDNNPYGSFARHDSNTSDVTGLASPAACKASKSNGMAGLGWVPELTIMQYHTDPRRRLPRHPPPLKGRQNMSRSGI